MNDNIEKDVLIALLKDRDDLRIAMEENWYRIPVSTKRAPLSVKNDFLKYIAFYQPKTFEDYVFADGGFIVSKYSKVTNISIAKRKELFPKEETNSKSSALYYKIEFENPNNIPQGKIVNKRRRRILFINSTYQKLINAKEINDLFYESPLEETVWYALKDSNINAERQYEEMANNKSFFLDFAIFCKDRKLALECDGDTYHTGKELVQNDKRRDNMLESKGWNILRYTSEDIMMNLDKSISQVRETINNYGGLQNPDAPANYSYVKDPNDKQINLFDL